MNLSETLYFWLVPTGIVIGHIGIVAKFLPRWPWLARLGRALAWFYAGAVVVAWVLRYQEAGHLPLFGTYESALSLALAIMVVAVAWEVLGRFQFPISPIAALISGALLNHGRGYDPTPYALTISERSWVVDIHAWLAWFAFGVLAVNSILALRVLLPRRTAASPAVGEGLAPSRFAPPAPGLVFSLQLGFLLHTGMLAFGSVYKFMLFGSAWSFDPIESMALVAWLAYGTLLHMVLFAGWEGKRLAAWCFGLFFLLVVSYRGIVYFPGYSTYHIFDMNLRIHLAPGEEIPEEVVP